MPAYNGRRILISATVNGLLKENNFRTTNSSQDIKYFSPREQVFFMAIIEALHQNAKNLDFNTNRFCQSMAISKSKLYRNCVGITGQSPNSLIRNFRLHMSLDMLKRTNKNISEIAFDTGFNSPSYFSKCFHKKFGVQPNLFIKG